MRCLIVEDDSSTSEALAAFARKEGLMPETTADIQSARRALEGEALALALIDLNLPDGSGLDLVRELGASIETQVVVVSGEATVDAAIEALRFGADDFITKPVDTAHLRKVLRGAAKAHALRSEIRTLRGELRQMGRFGQLLGSSKPMQHVYELIERVAPTDATVFITGETGTGKEVVAETIHHLSVRRSKPFVPINCGSISESLLESELFGHEKGSFTGAEKQRKGVFERAGGGTLFLDEITEMPIEQQVNLLRVLESGKLVRVGGSKEIEVDARVVVACNRDPREAVKEGRLREDLLFRLLVFPIELPPLRDREDDVVVLAEEFLRRHNEKAGVTKTLTPGARELLLDHEWSGNVRELKNMIERAFILAKTHVDADCFPSLKREKIDPGQPGSALDVSVGMSIADAEKCLILATLEESAGDKQAAARVLGISLKTLYNRLKLYDAQSS